MAPRPPTACAALPAVAQPMTPRAYVAAAGASDLYERESSRIVLQTTQDPKVRAYATMMIADHAKSTAQVKAAAAPARRMAKGFILLSPVEGRVIG